MKSKSLLVLFSFGSVVWTAPVLGGTPPTAIIKVVPVPAKVGSYPGGTTIVGNELFAPSGGFRAWFEVKLSNWDPNGDGSPALLVYQIKIDSSGYADADAPGDQPDLAPPGIPCTNDAAGDTLCRAAFGEAWAKCHSGTCKAGYNTASGTDRPADNWCAPGGCVPSDVDVSTYSYRYYAVYSAPLIRSDGGIEYYGGTLVLDIPAGAIGTYTVNLMQPETFMADTSEPPNEIPTASATGFKVTIGGSGACCYSSSGNTACAVNYSYNCVRAGDVYAGYGTSCRTATCLASPRGACCIVYAIVGHSDCIVTDGGQVACDRFCGFGDRCTYLGNGTSCDETPGPSDNCPTCGDNQVNGPGEQCDGTSSTACSGLCRADCTCPPSGGACSPDADGDGIQDGVDSSPNVSTNDYSDSSTTPDTVGAFTNRGNQVLCASDATSPYGVNVGSLSGGSTAASADLQCVVTGGSTIRVASVTAGTCVTLTCKPGPVAEVVNPCPPGSAANAAMAEDEYPAVAAVGDVTVELLDDGVVIATLTLPEGDSVTYNPETLEVDAPSSNSGTLILLTADGERPLSPGQTIVLGSTPLPAVAQWGMVILTLSLLGGLGARFRRRVR